MKTKDKNSPVQTSTECQIEISSHIPSRSFLKSETEDYRQINLASFQHNFKALIGHYKSVLGVPQVG